MNNMTVKHALSTFVALSLCLVLLSRGETVAAASSDVVPIKWTAFKRGQPVDVRARRVRDILTNANRYALKAWYIAMGYESQPGEYLIFGGVKEPDIRRPASQAFALAVSVRTGAYDPVKAGASLAEAQTKTIKLIKSLARFHKANTSEGWGDHWQSAFWAALVGHAGWLLWDDLLPVDQEYLRRMVEHEANRFNNYQVPYYKSKTGTLNFPGDTKAEENAWNAMILQLTTAMMPHHPNWKVWMSKNIELMISAFARPEDQTGKRVWHGKPLAQWLNGSNIESDGTLANHDRIHPDYMTTINFNINAALVYPLAGMPTPEASFFNADVVYRALVELSFSAPPYAAPGGTIYRERTGNIYYPQDNDWGTHRRMHFALTDAQAHAFGFDSLVKKKGDYWERYHARVVLEMQNRHADGHAYADGKEDTYDGREEWVAWMAACSYLTKWIMHQGKLSFTNETPEQLSRKLNQNSQTTSIK